MKTMDRLEDILVKERVPYEILMHPAAYTSQRTAQAEHISGKDEAKVVMVKADGKHCMAVVPATHRVDLLKLSALMGVEALRLESEEEFIPLFPDCEPGAMPPFGQLYNVPVYVDLELAGRRKIVFNAGSHTEGLRMNYRDFKKIVQPTEGDIARRD